MEDDKELWELYPHIWKTKAAFFNWMRGGLRRALWERNPVKLEFKNEYCKPPPEGYIGRAKSGEYCALSGEWVGKSAAEIDHIHGNVSLQGYEDIENFVRHLCAKKSNLQYVGKYPHEVKSYADKHGLTYDEALIKKRVIAITKGKVPEQNDYILRHGGKVCKNKKERDAEIERIILEQMIKET